MVAEVIGFVDKVELDSSAATYYTVQCSKEGSTWTINKRYSQFYAFEQDIRTQVTIDAPFPGKLTKITSLTMAQKEERRVGISKWTSELLMQPLLATVIAQVYNFFEVMENVDLYESKSSMRRHVPGRVLFEGFVHKLGGNKDDPYNLSKGTWSRRYMVLQDDLRYFVDEKAWRKGAAPKGVVSLDNFFVTQEGGPGLFTIHAVPWPLICRVDDPAQAAGWMDALNEFAYGGYIEANENDSLKPKVQKQLSKQGSTLNVLSPVPSSTSTFPAPVAISDAEIEGSDL